MRYANDIFISYAHIDNQPLVAEEEGWVSNLHKLLEIRLSQLMGQKPKIWRDKKLGGNEVLEASLKELVTNSAVILSIITPRYLQSDWCLRELEDFYQKGIADSNLAIGTSSRIFKVVKTHLPFDALPNFLQQVVGYEFFQIDQANGRARELGKLFGPESERQFWAKLDDLAHDLADLLNRIYRQEEAAKTTEAAPQKESLAAAPEAVAATVGHGSGAPLRKVFLAETPYELREQRDMIMRHLKDRSCIVYPEQPLPMVEGEAGKLLATMLSECELSIHLFGKNYGMVPEDSDKSFPEIQNASAAAVSMQTHMKRLIWINPEVSQFDPREESFIQKVRTDPSFHLNAEIFETSLEALKPAIIDRLQPKQQSPTPSANAASSAAGGKLIYLICDERDMDAVRAIEDLLFDKGFDVLFPLFSGSEEEIRLEHMENLKMCDGVLIYYGEANELWLRAKLRELLKIMGYGRTQPLLHKGIFMADPQTETKERLRTHEALVMRGFGAFDAATLHPFISDLNPNLGTTKV
jgi:hypothetical protein